jgi:ferrous iron transport protein A
VDARTGQLLLCDLAEGEAAEVLRVRAMVAADGVSQRLRDLGFVAGAICEVVARMWPAGDPLAVRIAGSTFALRRGEAACIEVERAAFCEVAP